jgi:hypothetical protein
MSIAKNARTSQIMRNIESGHYVGNKRFQGYGTLPEDIPSWDYRARRHGQVLAKLERDAQRKIRKNK